MVLIKLIVGKTGYGTRICQNRLLSSMTKEVREGYWESRQWWLWVCAGKQVARRTLVMEDRTRWSWFWALPEAQLNTTLFRSHAANIWRWRTGQGQKFLLVEFNNSSLYQNGITVLQNRFEVCVANQICVLRDHHTPNKAKSRQWKPNYRMEAHPEKQWHYRLMNSHGHHLTEFECYTGNRLDLNSLAINQMVHGEHLISTLQYKLRFFIAHHLEEHLRNINLLSFPSQVSTLNMTRPRPHSKLNPKLMQDFHLVPFGSDASGFGTSSSDIDLCLVPQNCSIRAQMNHGRAVSMLHSVASALKCSLVLDGLTLRPFTRVLTLPRAFVPIVKCHSRLLPELNLDISVDTARNSGVNMAAYLFYCSITDPRVRPLVSLLKLWARQHNIIRSTPGEWFSSFQLTSLAIAYLQQEKIVPNVQHWHKTQELDLTTTTLVNISLEREVASLLRGFFHFMVHFDFWTRGIDLWRGECAEKKPEPHPCYVANPFAKGLNICKTVSEGELERILSFCKQGLELGQHFRLEQLFRDFHERVHSAMTIHY